MSKKHNKHKSPQAQPVQEVDVSAVAGRELGFKKIIGAFLLLGACAAIVYSNSFLNPFIWDDPYLIIDNHLIKSFGYLPDIFKHHLYYSTAGLSNFYRPMQSFLVMIDYSIWKLQPFGYHLSSFIVHLACGYAAFFLIYRFSQRFSVAFLSGLLFLIHPINSTVVDYISSRADSQAALFMILSIIFFFKAFDGVDPEAKEKPSLPIYSISALCFILALLSKEMAIILPVLILASALVLGRRNIAAFSLPYFLILAVYVWLRLAILHFQEPTLLTPPSLGIRLLTSAEAFSRLILLIFVPKGIHVEKGLAFSSGLTQPSSLISLAFLLLVAVSVFWWGRYSRIYRFGWVWFFVAMLPMSNIIAINTTMADHWMYLPSVGLFAAFVGGIHDFISSRNKELEQSLTKAFLFIYVALIFVFGFLTFRQNKIWSDPEQFFRLAIESNPATFRAHNELGVLYLHKQQFSMAEQEFQKAIENNPKFDQAYDNLGVSLDYQGRFDEAIKAHKKAVEINPYNPKTYNNLGNAYFKTRQWDLAIDAYSRALKLNPNFKGVYNNLGGVYYRKGDLAKAKEFWMRALEIDPGLKTAETNLKMLEKLQEKK